MPDSLSFLEDVYYREEKLPYFVCDPKGVLSLIGALQLFSNVSAEEVKEHQENAQGGFWVVYSWDVHFVRLPHCHDQVRISTFVYDWDSFLLNRNFVLTDAKGEVLAYADSVWIFVSEETGHPMRLKSVYRETWQRREPFYQSKKIRMLDERLTPIEERSAHFSDLDQNEHVNNAKSVAWMLDAAHRVELLQALCSLERCERVRITYARQIFSGQKAQVCGERKMLPEGETLKLQIMQEEKVCILLEATLKDVQSS